MFSAAFCSGPTQRVFAVAGRDETAASNSGVKYDRWGVPMATRIWKDNDDKGDIYTCNDRGINQLISQDRIIPLG